MFRQVIILLSSVFLLSFPLQAREWGFSPSAICGNIDSLEQMVLSTEAALEIGRDSLHLDLFDGEFANSRGFSIKEIKKIRELSQLPLQIHIMAHNPSPFIAELKDFLIKDFDTIIIHAEAKECEKAAREILAEKLLLGIALKAETSIEVLDLYKHSLSTVLVFTVLKIGERGLRVYLDAYDQVALVKQYLADQKLDCSLLVDGGVYQEEIRKLALSGATDFVVGSAFYGRDGKGNSKELLKNLERELEFVSN